MLPFKNTFDRATIRLRVYKQIGSFRIERETRQLWFPFLLLYIHVRVTTGIKSLVYFAQAYFKIYLRNNARDCEIG